MRVESNSKKSPAIRALRFLGRAVPAALLAGALAACGGGGGGGGGGSQAPEPCDSQNSRGEGFALGSCAATSTNVFQPIEANVVVNGTDSYTLTLGFPADLAPLGGTTGFTATNRPPSELRNIIGVLQGQAYEDPAQGQNLTPPYVAITDFFRAADFETDTPLPEFRFASFGTWEKFAGSGLDGFNEGYLGIWFAERPGPPNVVPNAPTVAGSYSGRVVGLVGDGPGEPKAIGGRFGFSAPITIQVAGGRITEAQLGELTISSQPAGGSLTASNLAMNPVVFRESSLPPGPLIGALASGGGNEATITSGEYEARFFGIAGEQGAEIAGRFRFTTSNGLFGVASFGAIRQ